MSLIFDTFLIQGALPPPRERCQPHPCLGYVRKKLKCAGRMQCLGNNGVQSLENAHPTFSCSLWISQRKSAMQNKNQLGYQTGTCAHCWIQNRCFEDRLEEATVRAGSTLGSVSFLLPTSGTHLQSGSRGSSINSSLLPLSLAFAVC